MIGPRREVPGNWLAGGISGRVGRLVMVGAHADRVEPDRPPSWLRAGGSGWSLDGQHGRDAGGLVGVEELDEVAEEPVVLW